MSIRKELFVTGMLLACASLCLGQGAPPQAVTPVSPAAGAVNVAEKPTLSWNSVNTAQSYRVQVSTGSAFAQLCEDSTLSALSLTAVPLLFNTRYYWRAAASNAAGQGPWTADSFTTTARASLQHFVPVPPTLTNWTILVKPGIGPAVNGRPLAAGDEIGVFSTVRGQCIGAGVCPDSGNIGFPAYGRDYGYPDSMYGAVPGDTITVRIWDAALSIEVGAQATFSSGGGPVYSGSPPLFWQLASLVGFAPPAAPAPQSPAGGATVAGAMPAMRWNACQFAGSYRIQVSTSAAFSAVAIDSSLSAPADSPAWPLPFGAKYYWRVNARNACFTSAWSAADSFSIPAISVPVNKGWNFISFNTHLPDSLTADVLGALPGLEMAKTLTGVYWPAYGLDGFPVLQTGRGYQVYSDSADTIHATGSAVNGPVTPIALTEGWNLIGYLPQVNMAVGTATAAVAAQLVVMKDGGGRVYWPQEGLDGIGAMQAGRGYEAYMGTQALLAYPVGLSKGSAPAGRRTVSLPAPCHFALSLNTGNNAVVLANRVMLAGAAAPDGSEIGAFDGRGDLVGSGAVLYGAAAFSVWGKDELGKGPAGCGASELMRFRLWDGRREYPLEFHGSPAPRYVADGVFAGSFAVPTAEFIAKFALADARPNPFRGSARIFFDVPEIASGAMQYVAINVYDVKGSVVSRLVNGNYAPGHYGVAWDAAGGNEAGAISNMYIVEMKARGFAGRLKLFRIR